MAEKPTEGRQRPSGGEQQPVEERGIVTDVIVHVAQGTATGVSGAVAAKVLKDKKDK
jgi:hypothetical protein